jgi:hypothetical protein
LNATHHWFSVAAVLVAVAILIRRTTLVSFFAAGALLGLASFFTQTRGLAALLGIVLFLAWERHRTNSAESVAVKRVLLLCAGFVLSWLALNGYFIATLGPGQLFYYQATYAARYMTSLHSLGLPEPLSRGHLLSESKYLLIYFMIPISIGLEFLSLRGRRTTLDAKNRTAALLAFVALALGLEVAGSPNWLRIFCVAMPAIILFFWFIEATLPPRTAITYLFWIMFMFLGAVHIFSRHHEQASLASLPAGPVMTTRANATKLNWLMHHTTPGDAIFEAAWPGIYLPLRLRNPLFIDVLETRDLTRPEFVAAAVRQLQAAPVRYIIWNSRLGSPNPLEGDAAYHLAPFREFLNSRYRLVQTFADGDEAWERK